MNNQHYHHNHLIADIYEYKSIPQREYQINDKPSYKSGEWLGQRPSKWKNTSKRIIIPEIKESRCLFVSKKIFPELISRKSSESKPFTRKKIIKIPNESNQDKRGVKLISQNYDLTKFEGDKITQTRKRLRFNESGLGVLARSSMEGILNKSDLVQPKYNSSIYMNCLKGASNPYRENYFRYHPLNDSYSYARVNNIQSFV